MNTALQTLINKRWLYQGDSARTAPQVINSGFPLLNKKLHGGWPAQGVIDIQLASFGIGEVSLFFPLLRQCMQQRLSLWINPPMPINAPALVQQQLPLSQCVIARPKNLIDSLWVAEQALRSGCTAAVLLWCSQLNTKQARRLQLAAKEGNALAIILRPVDKSSQSLPVSLRLALAPASHRVHTATSQHTNLHITLLKQQGAWPSAPFDLPLPLTKPAPCLPDHSRVVPFRAAKTAPAPAMQ